MKTKIAAFAALALGSALALRAAPLTATTAVHTQPNATSPTLSTLQPGTEPVAAPGGNAPAGWMAIELSGPFDGWVENKDLTKNLDVKPGTPIRVAPKADAAVLTTSEKGDKTTISGLRGKWTQISLEKKLTGYLQVATRGAGPARGASGVRAGGGRRIRCGGPRAVCGRGRSRRCQRASAAIRRALRVYSEAVAAAPPVRLRAER